MTTPEVLTAARDLIADPKRWTQGAYARDENGEALDRGGTRACKWCAIGAIYHVAKNRLEFGYAFNAIVKFGDPEKINDKLGLDAVLLLFDKAIAAERLKTEIVEV